MNSSEIGPFKNAQHYNSVNNFEEEKLSRPNLDSQVSLTTKDGQISNLQSSLSNQMQTENEGKLEKISNSSILIPSGGKMLNTQASPNVKKTQYNPNAFDHTSLMNIPNNSLLRKRDSTESISKSIKNKDESRNKKTSSRKFSESSSSESSSPVHEKPSPKTYTSSDSRQKSKLSSHLKAIKESIKNQRSDEEDETEIMERKPSDRPKFVIDLTPIGIIEQEGETKKIFPQERDVDSNEKQYRVMGQERYFRTQERNLLEKLEKFFVEKVEDPTEKKEEGEVEEEKIEIVEDEFNFESRYFMYNPTKVCNRCKRPGHYEKWCPEDITIKCLFCVGGHRTDSCAQVVCFHCYGLGHRAKDCNAPGSLLCFRCGKKGHKSANCGMIVLKENVIEKEKKSESGDIKCIKCKRYGHSKCDKDTPQNRANKMWFDGLYKEEIEERKANNRERLNLNVLARAREAERIEFEGALSDGSFEDLANFKPASRPNSHSKSSNRREHSEHRKDYRHKKDGKDKHKKKKRFYN